MGLKQASRELWRVAGALRSESSVAVSEGLQLLVTSIPGEADPAACVISGFSVGTNVQSEWKGKTISAEMSVELKTKSNTVDLKSVLEGKGYVSSSHHQKGQEPFHVGWEDSEVSICGLAGSWNSGGSLLVVMEASAHAHGRWPAPVFRASTRPAVLTAAVCQKSVTLEAGSSL